MLSEEEREFLREFLKKLRDEDLDYYLSRVVQPKPQTKSFGEALKELYSYNYTD